MLNFWLDEDVLLVGLLTLMREASDVDLFRQLALRSGHISVFDRFFGLHLGLFEGVT